jgi:hypothetical protein
MTRSIAPAVGQIEIFLSSLAFVVHSNAFLSLPPGFDHGAVGVNHGWLQEAFGLLLPLRELIGGTHGPDGVASHDRRSPLGRPISRRVAGWENLV